MHKGLVVVALAVGGCGCAPGPDTVTFDLPPGVTRGTEFLAVDTSDESSAFVYSLRSDVHEVPLLFEDGEVVHLEALVFDSREPASLGLTEGAYAPPDGPAVAVDAADAAFVGEIVEGQFRGWSEAPLDSVGAMPLRAPACPQLAPIGVVDLQGSPPSFVLPSASSTGPLLAATATGLFEVELGATPPRARKLDAPVGIPTLALARAVDGSLWFGGFGGTIWQGRWNEGVGIEATPVSGAPSGGNVRRMLFRGEELFTLTEEGVLESFLDGAWQELARQEAWNPSNTTCISLVLLSDGTVLGARSKDSDLMVVAADGAVRSEKLGTDAGDRVCSLAVLSEADRVVAGTSFGRLFQRGPSGEWVAMDFPSVPRPIQAVAATQQGLVWGSENGLVGVYSESEGSCPSMPVQEGQIHFFSVQGDELLAATEIEARGVSGFGLYQLKATGF